jgi:hypothetical protein
MACRVLPGGVPPIFTTDLPDVTTSGLTCNDLYGFNCHTSFGWYCMIYVDHTVCYRPL